MNLSPTRSALLFSAAAFVFPTAAFATDDTDPDRDYLPVEIVVSGVTDSYSSDDGSTATKTPTPLIEVPQTVSIITDDQLQDQSVRQLSEALRYVPGISLETGEGHRDEIFIRGQETTADFYLDGLRDDAQYYRSLYNVERVEILKGANALIFGRGGGGGVVNRVSKTASLSGTATELEGSINTFGAFAVAADINQPLGDALGVRLNAAYEEFANGRDFYEGRFIGISPTITAELGPDTRLTATYSYDDDARVTDRGVPSLNGGPLTGFDETFFGDPDFNFAEAETHIGRARIDHSFSGSVSANVSVQYANYDKVYANILPRGITGASSDMVELSGYRDTTERENLIGQANLIWDVSTGEIEHRILAGFEIVSQDTQNGRQNALFDTGGVAPESRATVPLAEAIFVPPISLSAPVRSRDSNLQTLSAYVQDQISIGEHVDIIAGLRWDRFDLDTQDLLTGTNGDRVDEMVSPRVGIVLKPYENLSFYGSYTESFLPQAGNQFLLLSPGDAAFAPEKFTNYEVGAKWLIQSDLFLTAAVFRLDRTNSQAPDPNNTGLTVLTGASRVKGFEASLVGHILPEWEASLGYTYLDGEIRSTSDAAVAGTTLQQLPKHQISAWNRVQLSDAFGIGVGAIYQDEQFTSFSNNVVLPDYWRFDAAAFFTVSDRVSVQINVENIFNEDYFASAHGDNNIQPGAPITARFGLRISM